MMFLFVHLIKPNMNKPQSSILKDALCTCIPVVQTITTFKTKPNYLTQRPCLKGRILALSA